MKTAREADRSFSDFLIGLELWKFYFALDSNYRNKGERKT